MRYIVTLLLFLCLINYADSKEMIVVGADWCPYCIKQKNYLSSNPELIKDFDYEYIDVDEHPELVKKLNIRVYPTTFIFDDDHKKVGELRGFTSEKFKQWIKQYE